jgi:hypothetical protein
MSKEFSEKLLIKIGLSGIYWDKKPLFQILVNGEVIKESEITAPSGEVEYHEFAKEFRESTDHILSIRFLNKTPDQTVKADDYTEENMSIAKDMLLVVENLEIDTVDIPIGADYGDEARYGIYKLDQPVTYKGESGVTEIPGIRHMGWNGSYDIKFGSPFYIWLLENL